MEEHNQKHSKEVSLIIIVAVVTVIMLGGHFMFGFMLESAKKYQAEQIKKIAEQNAIEADQNPKSISTGYWNTLENRELGFSLKYPNDFFDVGRDPKILVGSCNDTVFPRSCPDISSVVSKDPDAGEIYQNNNKESLKVNIGESEYCTTKVKDAAMGHVYTSYYYSTVKNEQCLVVFFTTSSTDCDFYLPLEPGNTEQENNYNSCVATGKQMPRMLQDIISTFTFN